MILHNCVKIGLYESIENKKHIPTKKPVYFQTLAKTNFKHSGKLINLEIYTFF